MTDRTHPTTPARSAQRSGRPLHRLALAAVTVLPAAMFLAVMSLAVMVLATPLAAQHTPRRVVPEPIDFATSQNDNLFSLVRSQDDIHALETALDELREGKHDAAVRRLHELLRRDPRGVVPVAPGRYLGLRHAIVTVLANLSPAGDEAYEQLAAREGGSLFERPLHELSPTQLETLADRFPTTDRGLAARLLLGDRALEAGDGLTAAGHYRNALDATPIRSRDERRVVERMTVADVLVEPGTARARADSDLLPPAGDEILPVLPPPVHEHAAIGGGRSGATPMDAPVGAPEPHWREDVYAPGFDRRERGELSLHAIGDLDTVFVNTGREMIAFDPLRRAIKWVSPSPLRDFGEPEPVQQRRGFRGRGRGRGRNQSPYDTINQDMVLSAALGDDVVVCALQVPDKSVNVDFQASFRIMSKIPQRRLFAFSRQTGKLLWAHFDEIDGPRTRRYRGHDSCAPPIVAGDTIYAPIHDRSGAIAFSVAAYDAQTGAQKWRRLVCSSQQDVNMFGNARMEFAASPIALQGGVVYGTTNLGVAYALDATSGRVRWITAYDVVRMPRAMLHGQADRQVFFANNSPVVVDGVACMTPLDSQFALGLDVDTGEILWRLSYDAPIGGIQNRVQWLCGALDDEFVLGGAGIVAVKARPDGLSGQVVARQIVRPDQLPDRRNAGQPARAAVTADHVWVPARDRVLAFDRAGNARAEGHLEVDGFQPGNLALVDGAILSLRNRNFDLLLDPKALLERSRERVEEAPDDPAALLRLASLRSQLQTGTSVAEAASVQELYRRGLQACIDRGLPPSHPTRTALQRELFVQARAVAEAAAQTGAPDAIERLAAARELAPDVERWIEVHTLVLSRCRADRERFRRELDRLEQHAPASRMPPPLSIPVPTFVQWQRALAAEDQPARAVALWQQLLERYGDVAIGSETAGEIAEASIQRLVTAHGADVYAEVAARADEELAEAGDDPTRLEALTRRFPNSAAAERAGLRLLDRAVENGDLAVAAGVLARASRDDSVPPGVLRRVQVAATRAGNRPLALSMARRLQAFPDAPSDWHEDGSATFAAAAAAAARALETPAETLPGVPSSELMQVAPRTRQEYLRMLPTRLGTGFPRLDDTPLYVVAGSDLVAFDLDLEGRKPKELFSHQVDFLEHVVTCGTTLVVPDMERVFAVDYRTGELRWELQFDEPRLVESLGITGGVLHVSVQPSIPDGNSELIGVEPFSGHRLFTRPLGEGQLKPKPIDDELLLLYIGNAPRIERIDPVTGRTTATVPCGAAVGPDLLELRPDSLATRLYPQGISGDAERVFLPVDGRHTPNAEPQVLALDARGEIAWRWSGSSGAQLLLAQARGDRFVIVEANDQRGCRAIVLDATSGESRSDVDLGQDAAVLNWERSWLHNPAPAALAIGSQIDRQTLQRQLIVLGVEADQPTFVVPLSNTDGTIERTPQFGADFVAFGVRPRNAGGAFRIYAIETGTRQGAFPGGAKFRVVRSPGAPHGMTAAGPYTVLSTTQGLILLGSGKDENR